MKQPKDDYKLIKVNGYNANRTYMYAQFYPDGKEVTIAISKSTKTNIIGYLADAKDKRHAPVGSTIALYNVVQQKDNFYTCTWATTVSKNPDQETVIVTPTTVSPVIQKANNKTEVLARIIDEAPVVISDPKLIAKAALKALVDGDKAGLKGNRGFLIRVGTQDTDTAYSEAFKGVSQTPAETVKAWMNEQNNGSSLNRFQSAVKAAQAVIQEQGGYIEVVGFSDVPVFNFGNSKNDYDLAGQKNFKAIVDNSETASFSNCAITINKLQNNQITKVTPLPGKKVVNNISALVGAQSKVAPDSTPFTLPNLDAPKKSNTASTRLKGNYPLRISKLINKKSNGGYSNIMISAESEEKSLELKTRILASTTPAPKVGNNGISYFVSKDQRAQVESALSDLAGTPAIYTRTGKIKGESYLLIMGRTYEDAFKTKLNQVKDKFGGQVIKGGTYVFPQSSEIGVLAELGDYLNTASKLPPSSEEQQAQNKLTAKPAQKKQTSENQKLFGEWLDEKFGRSASAIADELHFEIAQVAADAGINWSETKHNITWPSLDGSNNFIKNGQVKNANKNHNGSTTVNTSFTSYRNPKNNDFSYALSFRFDNKMIDRDEFWSFNSGDYLFKKFEEEVLQRKPAQVKTVSKEEIAERQRKEEQQRLKDATERAANAKVLVNKAFNTFQSLKPLDSNHKQLAIKQLPQMTQWLDLRTLTYRQDPDNKAFAYAIYDIHNSFVGYQYILENPVVIDEKGRSTNKRYNFGLLKDDAATGAALGTHRVIGDINPDKPGTIYYSEGWANAGSNHAVTGDPSVICLDKGNMKKVISLMMKKYPNHRHIHVADNDQYKPKEGNGGVLAALENAYNFGCEYVIPNVESLPNYASEKYTDTSDIFVVNGKQALLNNLLEPMDLNGDAYSYHLMCLMYEKDSLLIDRLKTFSKVALEENSIEQALDYVKSFLDIREETYKSQDQKYVQPVNSAQITEAFLTDLAEASSAINARAKINYEIPPQSAQSKTVEEVHQAEDSQASEWPVSVIRTDERTPKGKAIAKVVNSDPQFNEYIAKRMNEMGVQYSFDKTDNSFKFLYYHSNIVKSGLANLTGAPVLYAGKSVNPERSGVVVRGDFSYGKTKEKLEAYLNKIGAVYDAKEKGFYFENPNTFVFFKEAQIEYFLPHNPEAAHVELKLQDEQQAISDDIEQLADHFGFTKKSIGQNQVFLMQHNKALGNLHSSIVATLYQQSRETLSKSDAYNKLDIRDKIAQAQRLLRQNILNFEVAQPDLYSKYQSEVESAVQVVTEQQEAIAEVANLVQQDPIDDSVEEIAEKEVSEQKADDANKNVSDVVETEAPETVAGETEEEVEEVEEAEVEAEIEEAEEIEPAQVSAIEQLNIFQTFEESEDEVEVDEVINTDDAEFELESLTIDNAEGLEEEIADPSILLDVDYDNEISNRLDSLLEYANVYLENEFTEQEFAEALKQPGSPYYDLNNGYQKALLDGDLKLIAESHIKDSFHLENEITSPARLFIALNEKKIFDRLEMLEVYTTGILNHAPNIKPKRVNEIYHKKSHLGIPNPYYIEGEYDAELAKADLLYIDGMDDITTIRGFFKLRQQQYLQHNKGLEPELISFDFNKGIDIGESYKRFVNPVTINDEQAYAINDIINGEVVTKITSNLDENKADDLGIKDNGLVEIRTSNQDTVKGIYLGLQSFRAGETTIYQIYRHNTIDMSSTTRAYNSPLDAVSSLQGWKSKLLPPVEVTPTVVKVEQEPEPIVEEAQEVIQEPEVEPITFAADSSDYDKLYALAVKCATDQMDYSEFYEALFKPHGMYYEYNPFVNSDGKLEKAKVVKSLTPEGFKSPKGLYDSAFNSVHGNTVEEQAVAHSIQLLPSTINESEEISQQFSNLESLLRESGYKLSFEESKSIISQSFTSWLTNTNALTPIHPILTEDLDDTTAGELVEKYSHDALILLADIHAIKGLDNASPSEIADKVIGRWNALMTLAGLDQASFADLEIEDKLPLLTAIDSPIVSNQTQQATVAYEQLGKIERISKLRLAEYSYINAAISYENETDQLPSFTKRQLSEILSKENQFTSVIENTISRVEEKSLLKTAIKDLDYVNELSALERLALSGTEIPNDALIHGSNKTKYRAQGNHKYVMKGGDYNEIKLPPHIPFITIYGENQFVASDALPIEQIKSLNIQPVSSEAIVGSLESIKSLFEKTGYVAFSSDSGQYGVITKTKNTFTLDITGNEETGVINNSTYKSKSFEAALTEALTYFNLDGIELQDGYSAELAETFKSGLGQQLANLIEINEKVNTTEQETLTNALLDKGAELNLADKSDKDPVAALIELNENVIQMVRLNIINSLMVAKKPINNTLSTYLDFATELTQETPEIEVKQSQAEREEAAAEAVAQLEALLSGELDDGGAAVEEALSDEEADKLLLEQIDSFDAKPAAKAEAVAEEIKRQEAEPTKEEKPQVTENPMVKEVKKALSQLMVKPTFIKPNTAELVKGTLAIGVKGNTLEFGYTQENEQGDLQLVPYALQDQELIDGATYPNIAGSTIYNPDSKNVADRLPIYALSLEDYRLLLKRNNWDYSDEVTQNLLSKVDDLDNVSFGELNTIATIMDVQASGIDDDGKALDINGIANQIKDIIKTQTRLAYISSFDEELLVAEDIEFASKEMGTTDFDMDFLREKVQRQKDVINDNLSKISHNKAVKAASDANYPIDLLKHPNNVEMLTAVEDFDEVYALDAERFALAQNSHLLLSSLISKVKSDDKFTRYSGEILIPNLDRDLFNVMMEEDIKETAGIMQGQWYLYGENGAKYKVFAEDIINASNPDIESELVIDAGDSVFFLHEGIVLNGEVLVPAYENSRKVEVFIEEADGERAFYEIDKDYCTNECDEYVWFRDELVNDFEQNAVHDIATDIEISSFTQDKTGFRYLAAINAKKRLEQIHQRMLQKANLPEGYTIERNNGLLGVKNTNPDLHLDGFDGIKQYETIDSLKKAIIKAKRNKDSKNDQTQSSGHRTPEVSGAALSEQVETIDSIQSNGELPAENAEEINHTDRASDRPDGETITQTGNDKLSGSIDVQSNPSSRSRSSSKIDGLSRSRAVGPKPNVTYQFSEDIKVKLETKLSAAESFANNIAAITLAKELTAQNRQATDEEKDILAQYRGWGGLSEILDKYNYSHSERRQQLADLVTPEEYESIKRSTLTAFYTPPTITEKIWAGLERMGIKGGLGLDPAFGTGNFASSMPSHFQDSVIMQSREIDNLTAEIAGHIHGNFVKNAGFEETRLPSNYLDFAISNVPFGDVKVFDKHHKDLSKHMIHDYFFLKTLDKVKPGGIVAFVTSSGTMNKKDSTARELMHGHADLVGAIRLPNSAFKNNAGTEVNSDILFLQKRLPGAEPKDDTWLQTEKHDFQIMPYKHISENLRSNNYFAQNPDMVIGEQFAKRGRFGMELSTEFDGDLSVALEEAIQKLPIDIHFEHVEVSEEEVEVAEFVPATEAAFNKKVGSYQINSNGNVAITSINMVWNEEQGEVVETLELTEVDLPKAKVQRMKGLIELRDCVKDHLALMLTDVSQLEYLTSRDKLNTLYDSFTKKFGPVNNRTNKSQFKADPDSALILSLEKWDKDSKTAEKADIFTERTINPPKVITHVDDAETAVIVSLSERTTVDIPYIEKLTGRDWEDLQIELGSAVFLNPDTDEWEHSSTYLSGNVVEKLASAKDRADIDEQFSINVEALEAVRPEAIPFYEIKAKLGSSWIEPRYVSDFVKYLTTGDEAPCTESEKSDYKVMKINGYWETYFSQYNQNRNSGRTKNTYGTKDLCTAELVTLILNNKQIKVTAKDPEGNTYVLTENTAEANAKADLIKAEFKQWLWSDEKRRESLADNYNNKVNVFVEPKYDGSKIAINGLSPLLKGKPFAARENQLNAIMRYLIDGRALFLHDVGVGKSFAQLGAIMKGKEVGKHNKAVLAVPNPVFPQMEDLAINHFPNANILMVDAKKLNKENREITLNQIATNNWDIIIIPHTVIQKLSVPEEFQLQIIENELEEVRDAIAAVNNENGFSSRSVKGLEKKLENAKTKILKQMDAKKSYDTVNIDEMGIDALFIDEADEFVNLAAATNMSHVAGVGVRDAQKSRALLHLTQFIHHKYGNKGVVLSTGTDIRNNMADQYTLLRYLAPDILDNQGIKMFDDYIGVFGEIQTAFEVAPEGTGFIEKTRLNKFVNLPEMLMLYRQVADVVNADDAGVVRPNIEEIKVAAPSSPALEVYMRYLGERAKRSRDGNPVFDNDNLLAIANGGKKAAIDLRLVDKNLPDFPESKVNLCIENVLREYHANIELKPSQIIFCDIGVPNDEGRFDLYNDMKSKLIEGGLTEDQVVFARDYKSDAQKQELQDKMNAGDIAVSIGSTENMGVGKNVQERLAAIHDLSVPWRVRDLDQRGGRIERFGNIFDEAKRYKYTTTDSFDLFIWNKLRGKALFAAQTKLSPRNAQREFNEDIEPSYAEIMAITTGNSLIKDAIETEAKVDQLKLLERTHQRAQSENKFDIANAERVLKNYEEEKVHYETLKEKLVPGDVTILGKPLGKDPDASKQINGAISKARKLRTGQTSFQIGEINGYKLGISAPSNAKKQTLFFEDTDGEHVVLGSEHNVGTIIKSIDFYINDIPDSIHKAGERIEYMNEKLASLKAAGNKPFEHKDELIEAEMHLKEINKEMALLEDEQQEDAIDPIEAWDMYLLEARVNDFENKHLPNPGKDSDFDLDLDGFDAPELNPV